MTSIHKPMTSELVCEGVERFHSNAQDERAVCHFMRTLAERLGDSTRIDRLTPRGKKSARRNTLSFVFGMETFPLHTDCAHWIVPPRYMLLGAAHVSPTAAATTVLAIPRIDPQTRRAIAAGVFSVNNGRHSFMGSICDDARSYYRYDPGCMTPIDRVSKSAEQLFLDVMHAATETRIQWNCGDVIMIDNWFVVHGRERIAANGPAERVILRTYVASSE